MGCQNVVSVGVNSECFGIAINELIDWFTIAIVKIALVAEPGQIATSTMWRILFTISLMNMNITSS